MMPGTTNDGAPTLASNDVASLGDDDDDGCDTTLVFDDVVATDVLAVLLSSKG
jgi:hypothetical protein